MMDLIDYMGLMIINKKKKKKKKEEKMRESPRNKSRGKAPKNK